jgi:hypothetical protein
MKNNEELVCHCLLASSEFSTFCTALLDKPAVARVILLEALKRPRHGQAEAITVL